jgi:hypothetical protein
VPYLIISILVTGCASKAADIGKTFVSPSIYSTYDCEQVNLEMMRYGTQISELEGKQNKRYKSDQMNGWLGTIILWPLLLFIKGDGEIASELKSAKGTMEALQQVSVEKKCGM